MSMDEARGFRFRDTTRAPFQSIVRLRYDRQEGADYAKTSDLSMEGMFVESEAPKPIGTLVQFELEVPGQSEPIQGLGDVVWVRSGKLVTEAKPMGMGIQFRYVDPRSRDQIFQIVGEYLQRSNAKRAGGSLDEDTDSEAGSSESSEPTSSTGDDDGTAAALPAALSGLRAAATDTDPSGEAVGALASLGQGQEPTASGASDPSEPPGKQDRPERISQPLPPLSDALSLGGTSSSALTGLPLGEDPSEEDPPTLSDERSDDSQTVLIDSGSSAPAATEAAQIETVAAASSEVQPTGEDAPAPFRLSDPDDDLGASTAEDLVFEGIEPKGEQLGDSPPGDDLSGADLPGDGESEMFRLEDESHVATATSSDSAAPGGSSGVESEAETAARPVFDPLATVVATDLPAPELKSEADLSSSANAAEDAAEEQPSAEAVPDLPRYEDASAPGEGRNEEAGGDDGAAQAVSSPPQASPEVADPSLLERAAEAGSSPASPIPAMDSASEFSLPPRESIPEPAPSAMSVEMPTEEQLSGQIEMPAEVRKRSRLPLVLTLLLLVTLIAVAAFWRRDLWLPGASGGPDAATATEVAASSEGSLPTVDSTAPVDDPVGGIDDAGIDPAAAAVTDVATETAEGGVAEPDPDEDALEPAPAREAARLVEEDDPTAPRVSTDGATRVQGLQVDELANSTLVRVVGDRPFIGSQIEVVSLASPPRFVVKIGGVEQNFRTGARGQRVQRIRTGLHPGPELHFVLDLAAGEYETTADVVDGDLLIGVEDL